MRAWELRAYDGPSGLEALQVPEPGRREGEVLVDGVPIDTSGPGRPPRSTAALARRSV